MHQDIDHNFAKSLEEWVELNFGSKRGYLVAAAKHLGMHKTTLKNIMTKTRGTTETNKREIAAKTGIPYDQMIGIAAGKTTKEHAPAYGTSNVTVIKHCRVIEQFSDQKLATHINQELVRLEKLNRNEFEKIANYISHFVRQIEMEGDNKHPHTDDGSGGRVKKAHRKG